MKYKRRLRTFQSIPGGFALIVTAAELLWVLGREADNEGNAEAQRVTGVG